MPRSRPVTTNAIPESLSNPYYLEAHRKALMNTMYGQGGILRVDVIDGVVNYISNVTGEVFSSATDAFAKMSSSGITTFSKLTGDIGTSSGNLRGSSGLSARLMEIQKALSDDPSLASRLGISDPSKLYFTTGSFKIPIGEEESARVITQGAKTGIVLADDGAFSLLQVFDPSRGAQASLTTEEISRLFLSTSKGAGGIISTDSLIDALLTVQKRDPVTGELKGPTAGQALASLYQKLGKRMKGAMVLKDVSIAGDDLSEMLYELSRTGERTLNEKTVRIFDPAKDLRLVAENLLTKKQTTGFFGDLSDDVLEEAFSMESLRSQGRFSGKSEQELKKLSQELKDFYTGNSSVESMATRLNNLEIANLSDLTAKSDAFKYAVESAYDGSSLMNSRFINSFKKKIENELKELNAAISRNEVGPEAVERMRELQSQLNNLKSGNLEHITGRVFMSVDGKPRMIKTVFDSFNLRGSLKDYAIVTTNVVLKKETALMGRTDAINLVLHGEPSKIVYQDPLMPGFHYGAFDESFQKAQESRRLRIMSNYRDALETGKIDAALRSRIFKEANQDINALPESIRNQASRNRLYAQKLREAIESGVDIRTMPQLMNYLKNFTASQLYQYKKGMYEAALEDTFRYAIDTEERFFAGRADAVNKARLGSGSELIELSDGKKVKALSFQIQGHKMLFGGDAASVFKQALGGFDLDDHGIVMPRIFQDASGTDRLGVFMFRQPTGPSEFIFAKASLGNSDTIRSFLGENDFFANTIEDFMQNTTTSDSDKKVYSLLRNIMNGENSSVLQREIDDISNRLPNAIEDAIIEVMKGAKKYGYEHQTINAAALLATVKDGDFASPLALNKERLNQLLAAGFTGKDEKFLVEQYRDGIIRRAFIEEGSFKVDDNFIQSIRNAVGESEYNSTFKSLEKQENKFLNKIAEEINKGNDLSENLQVAIESDYVSKARRATQKSDSIGNYINRLTIATSSSDQMKDILSQAESRGLSKSVIDKINAKTIQIVSPSDAVDLVVNLNGTKDIGLERSVRVLENFYDNATDREAAARALGKIRGIQDINDTTLVQALGDQMIETKGELIGNLRAVSMQYADDAQLIAGIDKEIIKQRLKGQDLDLFISGMLKGYRELIGDKFDPVTGEFIDGTDQKLIDDYNAASQLTKGTREEKQQSLINFLGLGDDNKYAHLAKSAKQGLDSFQSLEAENARLMARRTTSFASEINMSQDAVKISENILQEYSSFLEQNESRLTTLMNDGTEAAEIAKYQRALALSEINDKVYSMIYTAAEVNENVRVRDIVDNMEFLINARSPKLRNLMNGQIFGEQQNDLINLFAGAQHSRRLRDAQKQGRKIALVNNYNSMVDEVRGDPETQRQVLETMRQNVARLNRETATLADTVMDDLLSQAAMVYEFGAEKDFDALGLSEENNRIVRNLIADSQARRFLDETDDVEKILNFGRGSNAPARAPRGTLSAEDIDRVTLSGDGPPDGPPPTRNYKNFMDSWRDGQLGEAFKNPTVKKSAYAAAALIGASLIYSATKDRTPESASGPPLLPGGSAYENMAQRQPQMPNVSMFSGYNEGTSLQVNIEGDRDQIDSFTSVAGSNASSTMYRGLPQLGRDPYSLLAGSF
jgi:hypothetical protein